MTTKEHNKITVVREYCLARRIPYRIKGIDGQLYIDKNYCCFSIYNIPWTELLSTIDRFVEYNEYGYYTGIKNN